MNLTPLFVITTIVLAGCGQHVGSATKEAEPVRQEIEVTQKLIDRMAQLTYEMMSLMLLGDDQAAAKFEKKHQEDLEHLEPVVLKLREAYVTKDLQKQLDTAIAANDQETLDRLSTPIYQAISKRSKELIKKAETSGKVEPMDLLEFVVLSGLNLSGNSRFPEQAELQADDDVDALRESLLTILGKQISS